MDHFAGLDVSVKATSVCIVDDGGRITREVKVASEPDALLAVLTNPAYCFKRVGLEAGPLSQWLFSALAEASLPVVCVSICDVCFTPESCRDCRRPARPLWGQKLPRRGQRGMSALPPKADIRPRDQDVCFGPQADIAMPNRSLRRQARVTCPGSVDRET
jgi:hypothetical protein